MGQDFLIRFVATIIYVVVGLIFFALAYIVIDKVTPFSLGQELRQDKNVAIAIVLGSIFLGIAVILAAAIHG